MKKYFVMSDIHSFFDPMQKALLSSGFKIDNDEHILIICGDIFDRGNQSQELFDWLFELPQDRLILVKGNHELLYFELLEKEYPENHDFSNGTVRTFCSLAKVDYSELDGHDILFNLQLQGKTATPAEIRAKLKDNWRKVRNSVAKHPATKWLSSKQWLNYFELDNLIFVHSFIPLRLRPSNNTNFLKYYPTHSLPNELLEPVPNWRSEASDIEWNDATWGCPWKQFSWGLFDKEILDNKTLVCGHWHTSDFHRKFEGDMSNNLNIFFSDNLIALDACTAASDFCNVLVIDYDNNAFYDQNKKYLGAIKNEK